MGCGWEDILRINRKSISVISRAISYLIDSLYRPKYTLNRIEMFLAKQVYVKKTSYSKKKRPGVKTDVA